jgi:hypothetical protein
MTLPEFITYCTLKDLIVLHEPADVFKTLTRTAGDRYKLVIENDNYLAVFTYIAGDHNILYSQLLKVDREFDEPVSLPDGLENIIPYFV